MGDGADAAEDRYEDAWEYNQRNPDDPDNVDPYAEFPEGQEGEKLWEEPEIRTVPLTEIDWIASLEPICFPKQPWTQKALLEEYSYRGYRILAVERKAYIAIHKWGTRYWITALAVELKHRRKGLAEWLLTHVIDEACRTYKEFRFFLKVDVENEAALNLYFKHGFAVTKYLEDYYGKGHDAFEMALIYE